MIASPLEIEKIRLIDESQGKLIVTPGIRSYREKHDDQKRVMSPKKALENGANFIVVGRPIYRSTAPLEEVNKLLKGLNS